jgi:hypothetical protein
MTALALAQPSFSYASIKVTNSAPIKFYQAAHQDELALGVEVAETIEAWLSDTELMSSIDDMLNTDSYKELIAYGKDAIPKIIESLSASPSLLGMAAAEIVGENPITEEIRGDVRAMTGAWIGWYQRARHDFI